MNHEWSEDDIANAVARLALEFPQVDSSRLIAAVQLCAFEITADKGTDVLTDQTRAFLLECGNCGRD